MPPKTCWPDGKTKVSRSWLKLAGNAARNAGLLLFFSTYFRAKFSSEISDKFPENFRTIFRTNFRPISTSKSQSKLEPLATSWNLIHWLSNCLAEREKEKKRQLLSAPNLPI